MSSARILTANSRQRELEVIATLDEVRALQVAACSLRAQHVVGVEIERDPRMNAEPCFERHAALQGPPTGRHASQADQQALEGRLPSDDEGGNPKSTGVVSEARLDGRAESRRGRRFTHRDQPPRWRARRVVERVRTAT